MSLALQVLVSGLAAGAVYGLVAIGYVLVYRLTGIVYFAFGDLVGLAVFAALLVAAGTGPVSQTNVGALRLPRRARRRRAGLHRRQRRRLLARGAPTSGSGVGRGLDRRHDRDRVRSAGGDRGLLHATELRLPGPLPFKDVGHGGFVSVGGAAIQVRAFSSLRSASPWPRLPVSCFAARSSAAACARRIGRGGSGPDGDPGDEARRRGLRARRGLAALAAVVAAPSAPFGVETGSLLGVKALLAAVVVGFSSPFAGFVAGLGVGVVESGLANFHAAGFELGPAYHEVVQDRDRPPPGGRACVRRHTSAGAHGDLMAAAAVLGQTRGALVEAVRDGRTAWNRRASLAVAVVAAAAIVPALPLGVGFDRLAGDLYLAAAAVGLGIVVGVGGMPSLGQGAFVAVGAFGTALLGGRWGWPTEAAVIGGTLAAAAGGVMVGVVAALLRPALVAVFTWLVAWLVAVGLVAFPSISGGARGIIVESGLSATTHYELALLLAALAVLLYAVLARTPAGVALAAARQNRESAETLGVPVARLRAGAFVAGAGSPGSPAAWPSSSPAWPTPPPMGRSSPRSSSSPSSWAGRFRRQEASSASPCCRCWAGSSSSGTSRVSARTGSRRCSSP